MGKLLELLEKLVRAIFGPGDERDTGGPEPAPQAPKAEAVVGWEGDPPYRYIDVSRYQVFCADNSMQPMSNIVFSKQINKRLDLEISVVKLNGQTRRIFRSRKDGD